MTAPLTKERLAEIEARHRAQTPGPYRWEGIVSGHCLRLMAHTQPWRPIVMDFVRWGMNRAQPRFRDETHSIGIMAPAKDFIAPTAEHRPWEVGHIDHPDAIGLAASWQDKEDLLAEVERLRERADKVALALAGSAGCPMNEMPTKDWRPEDCWGDLCDDRPDWKDQPIRCWRIVLLGPEGGANP